MSKTFEYSQDGLSYTVTIREDGDGNFVADIEVTEGSMDVNAVYWSSEDYEGDTAAPTRGPLNMNGEGSQYEGEDVTWEDGKELSDPGLGREGENKDTFIDADDPENSSYTVDLDGVTSLDEIDFFGIRATSVNGDGSIKGVSGDPEDAATYPKVYFASSLNDDDSPAGGLAILADQLDDDQDGTFEDYLARFEDLQGDPTTVEEIIFYDYDEDGNVGEELFRLEGPFDSTEDMLAAYQEATSDEPETQGLLSSNLEPYGDEVEETSNEDEDNDPVLA